MQEVVSYLQAVDRHAGIAACSRGLLGLALIMRVVRPLSGILCGFVNAVPMFRR
jgi:hypothetical protein